MIEEDLAMSADKAAMDESAKPSCETEMAMSERELYLDDHEKATGVHGL